MMSVASLCHISTLFFITGKMSIIVMSVMFALVMKGRSLFNHLDGHALLFDIALNYLSPSYKIILQSD
jgi:hypothetical protein